jgi:hypothetical protein
MMHDANLLIFGCAASFVALAGAYVHVRERLEAGVKACAPQEATLPKAA